MMAKMSEARKKIQSTLRRKFNWRSNTNYNRGCILLKEDVSNNDAKKKGSKFIKTLNGVNYLPVVDLAVCMDYVPMSKNTQIRITLTEYADYGLSMPDRFEELSSIGAYMSFEELELVYQAAKAMYEENKKWWDRSNKMKG